MGSSQIQKIIGIVVLVAVVGFSVYYFFFNGSANLSIGDSALPSEESPVGGDLLVLAAKLDSVKIEPDIFETPLFKNLKDLSTSLMPEAQSRPNPFAPIGNDSSPNQVPQQVRTPSGITKSSN